MVQLFRAGSWLIVLSVLRWAPPDVLAIAGPGAAGDAGHPTVGIVLNTDISPASPGVGSCSATVIGTRRILTAGHCVNSTSASGALVRGGTFPMFRFSLAAGQPIYRGLAVQIPTLNLAGIATPDTTNVNDLALIITDADIAIPGGGAASAVAGAAPAVGAMVTIVGFGSMPFGTKNMAAEEVFAIGAAAGPPERRGADEIEFRVQNPGAGANQNFIQHGDSGGPSFNAAAAIVGVHSRAPGFIPILAPASWYDANAVQFAGFVGGAGQNHAGDADHSRINQWVAGAGNQNWGVAANWAAMVPGDNDVAVVDVAAAPIVNVNVATAALEGLLNNEVLNVNGGNLTVTGISGAYNGSSGNLTINAGQTLAASSKFENRGTVRVNGTLATSQLLSAGPFTTAAGSTLWVGDLFVEQAATFAVAGGGLVTNATNKGTLGVEAGGSVTFGTVFNLAGATLETKAPAGGNPAGRIVVNGVLHNQGQISVKGQVLAFGARLEGIPPAALTLDPSTLVIEDDDLEVDDGGGINGEGVVQLTGSASFVNGATDTGSPQFDTRLIAVEFAAAGSATGAFVSLEVGGLDIGPDFQGLDDPFALSALRLEDAFVTLQNAFDNRAGAAPEALYVGSLVIDGASLLNPNGMTLYYDPASSSFSTANVVDPSRLVPLGAAPTSDVLMPTTVIVAKPGELFKFVSKGSFTLPDPLTSNPTVVGGTLTFGGTTGGQTYALGSAGWLGLGPGHDGSKGFKFKGTTCRTVIVKAAVVKGVCKPDTGDFGALPEPGPVDVVLTIGTGKRYCASCGGTPKGRPEKLFKRTACPPPPACPAG